MTIPESIVDDIVVSIASLVDGVIPLILIMFGIGIAFYVVESVIDFLPRK